MPATTVKQLDSQCLRALANAQQVTTATNTPASVQLSIVPKQLATGEVDAKPVLTVQSRLIRKLFALPEPTNLLRDKNHAFRAPLVTSAKKESVLLLVMPLTLLSFAL